MRRRRIVLLGPKNVPWTRNDSWVGSKALVASHKAILPSIWVEDVTTDDWSDEWHDDGLRLCLKTKLLLDKIK